VGILMISLTKEEMGVLKSSLPSGTRVEVSLEQPDSGDIFSIYFRRGSLYQVVEVACDFVSHDELRKIGVWVSGELNGTRSK